MSDTRKIIVHLYTGYCGTNAHEFYEINADAIEEAISEFCWELARDNAAAYGIYPEEDMPNDVSEDDTDHYSDDIEGYYEDYNPEEHDGFRTGSSDEPEFQRIYL